MFNRLGIMLSHTGAALILATVSAHAATVTYNDVTSWLAATTGDTNISFTAPSGGTTDYSTPIGLFSSGVRFQGIFTSNTGYQLITVDQTNVSPFRDFGPGASLVGPGYVNSTFQPYIRVTLPASVTAFSTNLATVSPNGLNVQVTLSDHESFNLATGTRPSTTFFGLTADAPISYIDFAVPAAQNVVGASTLLKNFQFGTASSGPAPPPPADTPEAATFILIGTGLVMFRTFRKHMRPFGMNCA